MAWAHWVATVMTEYVSDFGAFAENDRENSDACFLADPPA